MFENNLIAGSAGQATGFYPYAIDQSLRFNDDDSAYLSRTPATAGNRKTWTWSAWVKRGNLGTQQFLISTTDLSSTSLDIRFEADNTLTFGGAGAGRIETTSLFRDVSAWYHVVCVFDTTQATSTDRLKIYVNGKLKVVTGTYPSLNYDGYLNNSVQHNMGGPISGASFFDGYLAEINFIDGQALDPTSFGEFKSGVWVANKYTGTYGTNGFYLPFTNGLGDDESGNGNDWTPNNLAATDIVLDSPTNNFATWNVLDAEGNDNIFSEGNLEVEIALQSEAEVSGATFAFSQGKFYWEERIVSTGNSGSLVNVGIKSTKGFDEDYWIIRGDGESDHNGNQAVVSGVSYNVGDTVGVAVDLDSGKWWISVNGSFVGDPNAGTGEIHSGLSGTLTPFMRNSTGQANHVFVANFGQDSSFAGNETAQGNTDENGIGDFYYTPPAGFLALCTANLPEPAISPADDESPSDYFNTILWAGDDASPRSLTGVGFAPNWVWIKCRSDSAGHVLYDSVRGATKSLSSDGTASEQTEDQFGYLSSFDGDGFTLEEGTFSGFESGNVNMTGRTYVAWNWKANGAGVTNTDGSITSTVSASPESGFSIVSYTGTGANATVGHGLDSAPEMIIAKSRTVAQNWAVYHASIGNDKWLQLNNTTATITEAIWQNSTPTSTIFSLNDNVVINGSGDESIAYCFHSVEGYSAFGSYTGNGSTDGPFVYTGFRPAFVIYKRTDGTGNWGMLDSVRSAFNVADDWMGSNLSNAESEEPTRDANLLSNGFKLDGTNSDANASGGTYIYMAFAENPFKFSNAR